MSFHNTGKIKDFTLFVTNTYHGDSGSLKSLSHRNALRAFVFVLSLSMKKSERIHVFDCLTGKAVATFEKRAPGRQTFVTPYIRSANIGICISSFLNDKAITIKTCSER